MATTKKMGYTVEYDRLGKERRRRGDKDRGLTKDFHRIPCKKIKRVKAELNLRFLHINHEGVLLERSVSKFITTSVFSYREFKKKKKK